MVCPMTFTVVSVNALTQVNCTSEHSCFNTLYALEITYFVFVMVGVTMPMLYYIMRKESRHRFVFINYNIYG